MAAQQQFVNEDGSITAIEPDVATFDFGDAALERVAAEAESRVAAMKAIKKAALKLTNTRDWVIHGSGDKAKPYMCASGAEKIAAIGVSVLGIRHTKDWDEDEKGRYYIYTYNGIFSIAGRSLEAIGTCTSRDQFFAVRQGELKPLGEVPQDNIAKAAYSNMLVNGISRLLGFRSVTLEELKETGLDISKLQKVEYAEGTKGAPSDKDKEHHKELGGILVELSSGDTDEAKDMLEDLTAFEGDKGPVKGLRTLQRLKGKRLDIALDKARRIYQDTTGEPYTGKQEEAPLQEGNEVNSD